MADGKDDTCSSKENNEKDRPTDRTEKTAPRKKSKRNKEDSQKKKDLEKQIRKKVAFEEKSFRVVEKLVETQVNTDKDLIEAGHVIDQVMYEDVVEERSIASVCGYPVCGNILKAVPKQKYHISTQSNKVYDISDRKRYCSGLCYKASKFFSSQISTSPVWSRENEEPVRFTLMERETKGLHTEGIVGEVVIDHPAAEIRKELNLIEEIDRKTECKPQESSDKEPQEESEVTTVDDMAKQLIDLHLLDKDPEFSRSPSQQGNQEEKEGQGHQKSSDVEVPTEPVDAEKIELQILCEEKNIQGEPATEEVRNSDMDRQHFLKRNNQIQVSMDTGQSHNSDSSNFRRDIGSTHSNYCNRESADKSHGHINRATYYGYDENQQAFKVSVCREIQRCVILHRSTEESQDIPQSTTKDKHMASEPNTCMQSAKPMAEVVYRRSGLNKLCSAGFLKQPQEAGVSSKEVHRVRLVDDRTGVSSDSGPSVQSKTDRLMGLLDKRDALKDRLKNPENDRWTQGIGLSRISKEKQVESKLVSETEQKPRITDNISDLGKPSTVRNSRILENINRVSQQNSASVRDSIKDSDDDDDEDDIEIVQTMSNSHVTTGNTVEIEHIDKSLGEMGLAGEGQISGSTLSKAQQGSQKSRKFSEVKQDSKKSSVISPLDFIAGILLEWKTVETCKYFKGSGWTGEKEEFNRKYRELSRKVDAQIREHAQLLGEEPSYSEPTKSVPEFSQLVKKTKGAHLEIKESQGETEKTQEKMEGKSVTEGTEKPRVQGKKKKLFDHEVEEISVYDRDELVTEQGVHLPYVDSHSQTNLRRRIVLDRFNKVLPDLLGPLKMSIRDISTELKDLVYTFNLSSKNIVLKPAEWTLMGYLILKLLSRRVKSLKEAFREDYAVHFFNTVLHGVNGSRERVREIVQAVIQL